MATERTSGGFTRLADNPLVRVVAYYVLLFAATGLLIQLVPGASDLFTAGRRQWPFRRGRMLWWRRNLPT